MGIVRTAHARKKSAGIDILSGIQLLTHETHVERLEELKAVRFGEKSASRVPKVLLFGGNLFIC